VTVFEAAALVRRYVEAPPKATPCGEAALVNCLFAALLALPDGARPALRDLLCGDVRELRRAKCAYHKPPLEAVIEWAKARRVGRLAPPETGAA
jgi:hypothetical protein